jgi:hypothetical protein
VLTNRPFDGVQRVVTANQLAQLETGERDDIIARTAECCEAVDGVGGLLFDVDGSVGYCPGNLEQFINDLAKIIPSIMAAARVVTHSTSSHVYTSDGEQLSGKGNFHVYVLVEKINAIDLKKLKAMVTAKAWLAGLGHIFIDRTGKMHIRCLVDTAVWQHGRLVFEASALLRDGLTQNRPQPEFVDGNYIDLTEVLAPLCHNDKLRYDEMVMDAKQKASADAASIRRVHTAKRVGHLMKKGLTENQARETVKLAINGQLTGDHTLYFSTATLPESYRAKENASITEVSVASVLQYSQDFDRLYCADPNEPDYGGAEGSIVPNKAIILARGGRVSILSFAHGGRLFKCCHSYETLKAHCEALIAQSEQALVDGWLNAAKQADMDIVDEDRFVTFMFNLLKDTTKTSLKKSLKAMKDEENIAPVDQNEYGCTLIGEAEADFTPQTNEERRTDLWPHIKHIALVPSVLALIVKTVQDTGVVGEAHLIRATYLAGISPTLGKNNTLNLLARGESSLGKSHVIKKTLNFFPESHIYLMTDASPKALYYMEENALKGCIVFLQEANCLTDQDNPVVIAIRSLLSEGRIEYSVVVKCEVTGVMKT